MWRKIHSFPEGRPKPAVMMELEKGVKGQARSLGRRGLREEAERGGESSLQAAQPLPTAAEGGNLEQKELGLSI